MKTTTITLPLPNPKLAPNARCFRYEKARLTKEHRQLAKILAFQQSEQVPMESYRLVFHWRDRRRHDRDNASASCKAYLDGIADYLGQDDSEWGFDGVKFGEPDKANPRVEVIFTVKG